MAPEKIPRDLQFYKFSAYGFLKNIRLFEPFFILFFLEMKLNYVQIGTLIAVMEIATNLLEIPTGMIADDFGRRRSMIFSFLSYIASFTIFSFFSGFYNYIVAMLLFACGEAFRTGTHKAMILTYLEIKEITHLKVSYYGHTRGASQLGSALSSLLAAVVVLYLGSFRWVFLFSIGPYIMELFLMMSYPKELDGDIRSVSGGIFKEAGARFAVTTKDFLRLFKDRNTLTALLSSAVFSGLFKGIKDYLQPLIQAYVLILPFFLALTENRRSAVFIGGIYFILFLCTAFASRRAGLITDGFRNLSGAVNGTYLLGAGFIVLSGSVLQLKWNAISIIFFSLLFVLQGVRKPMSVAYISDKISSRIMATGLSGESQLRSLFSALFSFSMGVLVQYAGLSSAIIIIGLSALVFYPLVRVRES
jgi:MFS family permease